MRYNLNDMGALKAEGDLSVILYEPLRKGRWFAINLDNNRLGSSLKDVAAYITLVIGVNCIASFWGRGRLEFLR